MPAQKKIAAEPLFDIASSIFAEMDVQLVLSTAIDRAIELSGAERGIIILFSENGEISFETARNLDKKDIANPTFEVSRTIIERVKSSGEGVCLRNAMDDSSLSASILNLKLLSVIALPLMENGNLFGVVYLDNRSVEGAFSRETMGLIGSLARLISLAAFNKQQQKRLEQRVAALEMRLRQQNRFEQILGNHPAILEVLKTVSRVTATEASILINGESGTGKELIARAIHDNSQRNNHPFIAVNCGAISENLLETEFFGHVKGAFTGAHQAHSGWFERAHRGTIFLDEISEMPLSLQVKLLRVLQSGEYSPVGSSTIRACDVRIVAASNRDLGDLITRGAFREDLFFRLNVVEIELPPLRQRGSDILLLANHFLQFYAEQSNKSGMSLSTAAGKLLLGYHFPGNIRELQNIIQSAVILAENERIEVQDLPPAIRRASQDDPEQQPISPFRIEKQQMIGAFERGYLTRCLAAAGGNISAAARLAGIDIKNFRAKMKRYTIRAVDFKT